jgi:glycosyltransferase involved in cell wall biosynthesis
MEKILSVVWYKVLPAKYGGQKGIALFNKYLAREVELVCLCSKNNEQTSEVNYKLIPELPVSKTQFLNPFCWYRIISTVKKEKITHVVLEHPYHGIAGWLAKRFHGVKLIVHSHNIEAKRFKETGNRWWRLLAVYEKWVHRQANLNLFKTDDELDYAVTHFDLDKEKCLLTPYGIDPEEKRPDRHAARNIICQRHGILSEEKILLFAGTLDYKPNATAVENIYKEIAPRLVAVDFQGKIIICGRNKLPSFQYLNHLSHPMVINGGEVEDIENYFAAADVFINPVLSGGGVQTKVIDALSYGCNVVAFKNMQNTYGQFLFSANCLDWNDFLKQIENSHAEGLKPSVHLDEEYNWEKIIKQVVLFLKDHE